ncbi:phage terminase small subunit P27 family [Clostridium botulinum]|uniref:Phage terminase small subunit P27 family n=1 Tax=Clostridium botulinum TaxID=1491 RepID=A0A6B4JJ74_CLOBO|nr:phage terminase small subunit P27 family [Clostridium botulinum]EES49008.1 putative phage terminase, small subunit, P27 family [Clostridium botulinum E1 str. 'BoNT E Beluga']MBY6760568.1 phage terminase small subunit P27 family [Clostridium botulinum]MBY6919475.1 phage terminase small subunit P27 family [Clostridium botulinum]MCR1130353.1 phage terminase small subunit P27 family [Clostridium botulinum]NFJ56892.1 phage terminase small subunit P27 family [Clostridium botulinum]
MSRARKPLEMQKKHLTNAEITEKEQQEEFLSLGKEQLEKPPSWLIDDIAKNEFIRVVTELNDVKIIGNLDLSNVGGYCNAFSTYVNAIENLKGKKSLVKEATKNGVKLVENPYLIIRDKAASEMRKFGSLCGINVDGRLKLATVQTTKQQEDIIDEFGDI